jgi:hypothetical protein
MMSGLCLSTDEVRLRFVVLERLVLFSDSHPCIINLDSNTVLQHHNRTYCRRVDAVYCGKPDTVARYIARLPKYDLRPVRSHRGGHLSVVR